MALKAILQNQEMSQLSDLWHGDAFSRLNAEAELFFNIRHVLPGQGLNSVLDDGLGHSFQGFLLLKPLKNNVKSMLEL